jgi:hypothetical protein
MVAKPARGILPDEVSSFVGRTREVASARQVLSGTRLLTLTGPGGVGKTRLALRIAAEVRSAFRDGAWLIELAALEDPDLVEVLDTSESGVTDAEGDDVVVSPLVLQKGAIYARPVMLVLASDVLVDRPALGGDPFLVSHGHDRAPGSPIVSVDSRIPGGGKLLAGAPAKCLGNGQNTTLADFRHGISA